MFMSLLKLYNMPQNLRQKDLALITSIIINEDVLGGTIFQTFDKAYALAEKFQDKFSHDFNWENQGLDFDEAIILFTKKELGIISPDTWIRTLSKTKITIRWGVDDIRSLGYECTDEQGFKVLQDVERYHDANIGINWNVIDWHCENHKLINTEN